MTGRCEIDNFCAVVQDQRSHLIDSNRCHFNGVSIGIVHNTCIVFLSYLLWVPHKGSRLCGGFYCVSVFFGHSDSVKEGDADGTLTAFGRWVGIILIPLQLIQQPGQPAAVRKPADDTIDSSFNNIVPWANAILQTQSVGALNAWNRSRNDRHSVRWGSVVVLS